MIAYLLGANGVGGASMNIGSTLLWVFLILADLAPFVRLKDEIQNTAREKLHPSSIARELIEKKTVPYLASALAIGFVLGYSYRRAA